MDIRALTDRVTAVRHFNRFYTRQIGVLQETLLKSEFSLTEMRVLYELAHGEDITATALIRTLDLDAGYLSRILGRLQKLRLLRRRAAKHDARRSYLVLTPKGRDVFAPLDEASNSDVRELLKRLPEANQARLVQAMRNIESLLESGPQPQEAALGRDAPAEPQVELRSHRAGDMGWVIERHAEIYAREYGWNTEFEGLVARICAEFIQNLKPERERCWIAERSGERLGCIFLVQESNALARLRLLLVDPAARGLGLGSRLVKECLEFARSARYRRVTLWTNDVLVSARRLYEAAGFEIAREEKHRSFGKELVGQHWQLKL